MREEEDESALAGLAAKIELASIRPLELDGRCWDADITPLLAAHLGTFGITLDSNA